MENFYTYEFFVDLLIYEDLLIYFQNDISNFRFKLHVILYNSLLNGARGLPDNVQQTETPENSHDDVTMLDDLDILMSSSIDLTRTIKWRSRKDLLSTIYLNIRMITNTKSLE
jgi:hypothetical protein